jgi:hypothetical protein
MNEEEERERERESSSGAVVVDVNEGKRSDSIGRLIVSAWSRGCIKRLTGSNGLYFAQHFCREKEKEREREREAEMMRMQEKANKLNAFDFDTKMQKRFK